MILSASRSRQPAWQAWTRDHLLQERAITLGHTIDPLTALTYSSHLQSYLNFCKIYNFSVEPTTNTLSFYVVFMAHHINPHSVTSYLSGICNTLEPYFPNVRAPRNSALVSRTLAGVKKLQGSNDPKRKRPLTSQDLFILHSHFSSSSFDDNLFLAMLLTGFNALLRVGEMTWPDSPGRCSSLKLTLRHTCEVTPTSFSFRLPYHKGDRFFDGNTILVERKDSVFSAYSFFVSYLHDRNSHFPAHSELWLTSSGKFPTYSWFVSRL